MNDTRKIIEIALPKSLRMQYEPSVRGAQSNFLVSHSKKNESEEGEWLDALQAIQLARAEAEEAIKEGGHDSNDPKISELLDCLSKAEATIKSFAPGT